MALQDVLLAAQGPWINIIVGMLLSVLGEYLPPQCYAELSRQKKRMVFAAAALIVPILAATLSCALGYQVWALEATFWPAIMQGGVVAFALGTITHTRFMASE